MTSYSEIVGAGSSQTTSSLEKLEKELREDYDDVIDIPVDQLGDNYTAAVYSTGKSFLIQLRLAMGDESFNQFMKEYYQTYRMKIATTKGFIEVLSPYIEGNEDAKAICKKNTPSPKALSSSKNSVL